jgi:hypothetical protein
LGSTGNTDRVEVRLPGMTAFAGTFRASSDVHSMVAIRCVLKPEVDGRRPCLSRAKFLVQACSPKKPAMKRTTTMTPMM